MEKPRKKGTNVLPRVTQYVQGRARHLSILADLIPGLPALGPGQGATRMVRGGSKQ